MDYAILGYAIKELRKAKKMTQQELADALGKSKSSIQKYEKGIVEIPNSVIKEILGALGAPNLSSVVKEMADGRIIQYDLDGNVITEWKNNEDYYNDLYDDYLNPDKDPDKIERDNFYKWLDSCEIKHKPCVLNGESGQIFDTDGNGYKYFIPYDLVKFLPGECSRYTKAIIKINATNPTKDITDSDDPDDSDNKK